MNNTKIRKIDLLLEIPKEAIRNKNIIAELAKNDFRTKYAGSIFGIFWAFVQPVITILLYWFVFEVGFRASTDKPVPFVLWLIAGLVPWFFFTDSMTGGTNALLEYEYLVKKVVFNINILPLVKILSAVFVHLFFICFAILLFSIYRYFPGIYVLQLVYYTFCTFVLALGIVYVTSAVAVFFRDISQVVNILLQIGTWLTPIMWDFNDMGGSLPRWLQILFKLNPMFYIVQGYRDSLVYHTWFWHRGSMTAYFWIFVIVMLVCGNSVFQKLKESFADIL